MIRIRLEGGPLDGERGVIREARPVIRCYFCDACGGMHVGARGEPYRHIATDDQGALYRYGEIEPSTDMNVEERELVAA